MGGQTSKQLLMLSIKTDKEEDIRKLIEKHPELLDEPINDTNDYNAIGSAVFYGKKEAVKILLELGCDVNLPSSQNRNSPLIIACIRNRHEIMEILLEKGAYVEYLNLKRLNCLDYAVINNNYHIAFNLLNKTSLCLKSLDEYLSIMKTERTPLFNVPLFYETLENRTSPERIPYFNIPNDIEKKFEGKIPDPDETWSNFFKRVMNFEITKPPLVDIDTVPVIKRKSTYMKLQSKLLEIEYGQKVDLNDKKEEVKEEIKYNDVELKIVDDEKGKSKEDSQENKDYSEKPPSENEMLNVIEEKKDKHENDCENLNLNDNRLIDVKSNLDLKDTIIINLAEGQEKVVANQI